jgi:hypothetical protein
LARRWAIWAAAALGLLLLCAVVMSVLLRQPVSALQDIEARVRAFKSIGVSIQVCIVAWVAWRWDRIVAWGRRRGIVQQHEHRQALALRAKVVGFLIAYLLLVPIGPGAIYRFFTS